MDDLRTANEWPNEQKKLHEQESPSWIVIPMKEKAQNSFWFFQGGEEIIKTLFGYIHLILHEVYPKYRQRKMEI